jgi:hypothetical protein
MGRKIILFALKVFLVQKPVHAYKKPKLYLPMKQWHKYGYHTYTSTLVVI